MKLTVTRRVAIRGSVFLPGDGCDVTPDVARTLIATRFAVAGDAPIDARESRGDSVAETAEEPKKRGKR